MNWLWHLPTVKLFWKLTRSPCTEQLVAYQHPEQIKQQSKEVSKLTFLPNAVFSYLRTFVPGGILASVLLFQSVLVLLGGLTGTISKLTHKNAAVLWKYSEIFEHVQQSSEIPKGSDLHTKMFSDFWKMFQNWGTSFIGFFPLNLGASVLTNGARDIPYLLSVAPQPHSFPDLPNELRCSEEIQVP